MTYARQTINPATTADRRRVARLVNQLAAERRWNRRRIADAAGVNPYAVWRAQNERVRVDEVELWTRFVADVDAGAVAPCDQRVEAALRVLDRADRARSVSTLRELINETREILREK